MNIKLAAVATLLTITFFTTASPVTVMVTEKISDQSDSIVRQNARIKAQYAGIERLPVVMTGHEQLTDKDFTTKIKAYLVGEVDVLTMGEVWDRNAGNYTLTAQVSLNRQASLEMIDGIRNNLTLQKKLKNLYAALDKLSHDKSINATDYSDVYDRIMSVKGSALVRDTIASSITAKEDFLANSYRFYNEHYMKRWLDMVEMKITSVDEEIVYYSVFIGKNKKMAEEMEQYWQNNPARKNNYYKKEPVICLPGGQVIRMLPRYDVSKDLSMEHHGDERVVTEPHKMLYPVLCYVK